MEDAGLGTMGNLLLIVLVEFFTICVYYFLIFKEKIKEKSVSSLRVPRDVWIWECNQPSAESRAVLNNGAHTSGPGVGSCMYLRFIIVFIIVYFSFIVCGHKGSLEE